MQRAVNDPMALVAVLTGAGVTRGGLVAVAASFGGAAGLAVPTAEGPLQIALASGDWSDHVRAVEDALHPRWVWWSKRTASALLQAGVTVDTCWDVAAVHQLCFGGGRVSDAHAWAAVHDLDPESAPVAGRLDFFTDNTSDAAAEPDGPVRPDGHLRPEWVVGSWSSDGGQAAAWADAALTVAASQERLVSSPSTARSESAAELLCAEMEAHGLPVHRSTAEALITSAVGPRASTLAADDAQRRSRDRVVLDLVPDGGTFDLRSPNDVKRLLRRVGLDLPDTRAWRLESVRDTHPVVQALLTWRKAERIGTTFGYSWIDTHVGADDRLRGEWAGSDGAAGRMTAQAGLHNLPAELRPAIRAEPGHLFVRADLGQIEPRVLAVVSGDAALRTAAHEDDLYAPVAARLGVDRPTAKVAVLAAMYGQTSGAAGQALRGMQQAYPTAIAYLENAARSGMDGRDLRTFGGRLIRMWDIDPDAPQGAAAARGRFARNALVQGAAAELFKAWAATVRLRTRDLAAHIVLCLHDELLLHVPEANADEVAARLVTSLGEASYRWQRGAGVRFVADVSVVASWADAK